MRNNPKHVGQFFLLVSLIILQNCSLPDLHDRDVHPVGTSEIDTALFNEGAYQFPGENWMVYESPAELGWNEQKLNQIGAMADSLDTAALMIIHKGVLVYDWGHTDEKYITQSMRKGLLNSLYGVYWDKGMIDLGATLAELNINDEPPLSDIERSATVEQLLQSTSGVYHSALYEVGSWKRNKPEKGTHNPGERWYYNNWGFNALGTIFEQETGTSIGEAFQKEIADPLMMQDFNPTDVEYITKDNRAEKWMGNQSDHDAYMFNISARDLGRFGLLYLNEGVWEDQRILSEEWIQKTFNPVNIKGFFSLRFGYMWWIFENGQILQDHRLGFEGDIYYTSGNRGHYVFVIPYLDLVIVHRVAINGVDAFSQLKRGILGTYYEVDDDEMYNMLYHIRQAHPRYQ